MSYERRQFSGSALDSALSAGMGATDLTFTGADLTGWPDGSTGKFEVILDPDMPTEEHSLASSRVGNTVTYASIADRGLDDTTPQAHASLAAVRHGLSKRDVDEANYAVSQTVGQITAKGDLLVGSAANTLTKVTKGTAGQAPTWQADGSVAAANPTPAAHTHAEADVTSLTTDLSGKLSNPATAWAKGSLLVGTGAGTYDTLAVGASGTVPTVSGGTLIYAVPSSGVLGSTTYATAVTLPVARAALDTTNLTITFTAPASGKVLLRVSLLNNNASTSLNLGWYQHGTSTAVGTNQQVCYNIAPSSGGVPVLRVTGEQVITGLTPGQSYTYDLTAQEQSTGVQGSDFVLTAWAA